MLRKLLPSVCAALSVGLTGTNDGLFAQEQPRSEVAAADPTTVFAKDGSAVFEIEKPAGDNLFKKLATIPSGAVYFRKSGPPAEEWERDYSRAASDGMNTFRHWFPWSSIEIAPGQFDWADYDRHFDLAAQYGINVVVGEVIESAPAWSFAQCPQLLHVTSDGRSVEAIMDGSSSTGGRHGLCLDHPESRDLAGRFLRELATRYRDHPAMGAYDVQNEGFTPEVVLNCRCPASLAGFRIWLKKKYVDLDTLNKAWRRYSFTDWDQVKPTANLGPFPDAIDWVTYRIENAHELLKWRIGVIRAADPEHLISTHGAKKDEPLSSLSTIGNDPWRAGALVDVFGSTGGHSYYRNDGNWLAWLHNDLARGGANGKPFWAAELNSGEEFRKMGKETSGPFAKGRPRDTGRTPIAADVRMNHLQAYAAGATGTFCPRWRPLLDGPTAGCCGLYENDGTTTERAEMAATMAQWANDPKQKSLWSARPVRGEVALLIIPESQIFCALQLGSSDNYYQSAAGAFRAFTENNIQADLIDLAQLQHYRVAYLPYPTMLTDATVKSISAWIEAGGCLISEAGPAYFGDHGKMGTIQPNLGLNTVFGATQKRMDFSSDLIEKEPIELGGIPSVGASYCLQTYRLAGGKPSGKSFQEDLIAVDHHFGKGRTRLIGTMLGMAYNKDPKNLATREAFHSLLAWSGHEQLVSSSDKKISTRMHRDADGHVLWILNTELTEITTTLTLAHSLPVISKPDVYWGKPDPEHGSRTITVTVPARDAMVFRWR